MGLPELTKLKRRREADITPAILGWFKENHPRSVALEIKIKDGKIYDHQRIALRQVASGSFSYKIPDKGSRNPFDGFVLKNADAFFVICDGRQCSAFTPEMSFQFRFRP